MSFIIVEFGYDFCLIGSSSALINIIIIIFFIFLYNSYIALLFVEWEKHWHWELVSKNKLNLKMGSLL